MQFMEVTLGATDTFKKEVVSKYLVLPENREFEPQGSTTWDRPEKLSWAQLWPS